MPATIYTDNDAQLAPLEGKTLAVIGFGSQGHAHALNLKESGLKVVVGLYEGSKSWSVAQERGFEVMTVAQATQQADVLLIAVPDMKQKAMYEAEIRPHLRPGQTLNFIHGFTILYGLIEVPEGVNVMMVAPKGPGHVVRTQYQEGRGVPALIAFHQGDTDAVRQLALAWAKGIGASRAGVIETTFKEETETDLFGEQAVLCGGASALVQAGFETLVEAGYQPEMAYFECLHELKLIVDLMIESGVQGMRFSISETAEYGDYTRGPRVINAAVKAEMKSILGEIQDGTFARQWTAEAEAGYPNYKRFQEEGAAHPIEGTGEQLRALMTWLKRKNIQGTQAGY